MNIICHHKGRYNFYSTISDGFTYPSSISLEQLRMVIRNIYGGSGVVLLEERLHRAHAYGTSSLPDETLDDFLCINRAGENEKHLSTEECIDQFLNEKDIIFIIRSQIHHVPARPGPAWYWLYTVVGPDGYRSERTGLADSKRWAKQHWENVPILEEWK